jgi:8-oxo-dGTP pyrophosphatase MutT (NUDIX family)
MPLRKLIESRFAYYDPSADMTAGLLANVEGPVSEELRSVMQAPGQHAAVLIGLVERSDGLHIIMTRRAEHLSQHAGQVAFPGGRVEPSDATAVDAALREATEEIGLAAADVAVLNCLPNHVTGTGFVVTPVVGFVSATFAAVPDPSEVASVFEVPAQLALDPAHYEISYMSRFGSTIRSYALRFDGYRIWGATAAMLVCFRDIVLKSKL